MDLGVKPDQQPNRFLVTNLILLAAPFGLACFSGFTYVTLAWVILFLFQCFSVSVSEKTVKGKNILNVAAICLDLLLRITLRVMKKKVPAILISQFPMTSNITYFLPICVSFITLIFLAAANIRLKQRSSTAYDFYQRQRIAYAFEYLVMLIPIVSPAFLDRRLWSLPSVLSSLFLLGLKALRANKLYCAGRLLNYTINTGVIVVSAIYSAMYSTKIYMMLISMLALMLSSAITVFWEGNVITSQISTKPVYLEFILFTSVSERVSRLSTYDFFVKGTFMGLWIALFPSAGATIPFFVSLYSLGYSSFRTWNWSSIACILALAVDSIIDVVTDKLAYKEYLAKLAITVAIYLITELSSFLQASNVNGSNDVITHTNDILTNVLFYMELAFTYVFSVMKVDGIKCVLMLFVVWFGTSPSASRKFQGLFITILLSIFSTRFSFYLLRRYLASKIALSSKFSSMSGFDDFVSVEDVKMLTVYIVASLYRYYVKLPKDEHHESKNPKSENEGDSKEGPFHHFKAQVDSTLQSLCLPLMIISILFAALVSDNFGLITIVYLMLFIWFSVRGMVKDYKERSVFLKFTIYYSAFAILLCYSFQYAPLFRLVENVTGKSILADLGLFAKQNIKYVLSCYLAVLCFARIQYYYEYEADDMIEGFESKSLPWYIELFKRFLLLHSSRIISLCLLFSIIYDCSIFSLVNLVISLALLFTETLNRLISISLTTWIAADCLTKCVFHFEIFNREIPFPMKVLGFKRSPYSHVFDTLFWQLISLVVLAFQPALRRWQKQLLERYESITNIPLLDEYHLLKYEEDESNIHHNNAISVLSSLLYYFSFCFREFGREITCSVMYSMSIANSSIFGCIFASFAFFSSISLTRISHRTIVLIFLISSVTLFYQYGVYYLLSYNVVPWKSLPKSLSNLLGLPMKMSASSIILAFFACYVSARYFILAPKEDSEMGFTAVPKNPHSFTTSIKKKLIIVNVWIAYIFAFASAVYEGSIPSLILVFLSLYFFRIGSNIYLQKHKQKLIKNTFRYMILWEPFAIILSIPVPFILSSFPDKEMRLKQVLALAGLSSTFDRSWTLENTLQVAAIFMLVLQYRILKSPMASTIIRQLVEESRAATRRSDRFHLHRVEELKQQLDVDSAAADETKRRIKERSGLFSTMDIGDWLRVFHGGSRSQDSPRENIQPSPNPITLNVTKRRVESFIANEEKSGLDEIRQKSIEFGTEELFSPLPERFSDVDEKEYPRTLSGEIRFYSLSIYFWVLRTLLKWSEDYRHICELKSTYQLVERAKDERKVSMRMSIFILSIYYAVISNTSVLVAICCLFNSIYYASILSVIPSFLLLTIGACQRPYTRKTFWKQMIRYTTIHIFVLFISQTDFFHITIPTNVFKFAWSNFLGISGFSSKLEAFFGPFLLLLTLMLHRSMMRYMGTWHIQEFSSVEEHRLRRESKRKEPKREVKFLDLMRGFVDDFGGFLKSIGELPGKDYYLGMFFCDICSLVITCLNWNIFSGETIEEDMYFMKSVISNNNVPMGFVILTMIQALIIVLDRIIYCRKALKLKVILQLTTLGVYHAWVVFLVPLVVKRHFRNVVSLCIWYIFKFGYWYFSALQVKQGYPLFRTTNFLFNKFSVLNYYTFLCIRSLPLFMELRNIIDWTFTPSSLSIYMWFKFEQLYAMLYGIKSNRLYTDHRMGRRALGVVRTQWWKHTLGMTMILGLLLLVFWPLIWLSLPGAMVRNPVHRMKLTIGLDNFTLIDSLIFTQPAKVISKEKTDKIKKRGVWPLEFGRSDTQISTIPNNLRSINLTDADQLTNHLTGKTEVSLWVKVKFTRGFNQNSISVLNISNFKVPAQSIVDLIMESQAAVSVTNLLPAAYNLKTQGLVSTNNLDNEVTFELHYDPDSNAFSLMRSDQTPHQLLIHSHKVSAHRLSNYGIIGLYVTFVYTVARTLKNSLSNLPFRIPFEDLPSVDVLYAICEDLIRVREFGDYYSEEYLYWQLIEIFRRPEQLMYLTNRQ